MNLRCRKLFLATLVLAPLLSGCGAIVRGVVSSQLESASNGNAPDTAYVAGLKPLPSGYGLFVAAPVASNGELSSFAAGCGRWLYLHAAGQGELGKSPNWGSPADVRRMRKLANYEVQVKDVPEWSRWLGVTHVAVGKLSGSGNKYQLSYQLLDSKGKVLRSLSPITGSREQVVQGLPKLARQMAVLLKAKAPQIPGAISLKADDVAFLGALPWKSTYSVRVSPNDTPRLAELATRDALAGILYQRSGTVNAESNRVPVAASLLQNAPGNTMVVCDVAWKDAELLDPHRAQIDGLNKRYPNNYLLLTAESLYQNSNRQVTPAVAVAEKAVRAAPGNVLAWSVLSTALEKEAEATRRGRYSNKLSSAEWATLHRIYPRRHAVALKMTTMLPEYSFGWSELGTAATFNGDMAGADAALWKSLTMDPENPEAYRWALQFYQPKWHPDNAKLLQVSQLAAQNAALFFVPAESMVSALKASKQNSQIQPLLTQVVKNDPNNSEAHFELGEYYHWTQVNYQLSEQHYRSATRLAPQYAAPYSGLGDILIFTKNDAVGAEAAYRQAVALKPGDGYLRANLGRCLAMQGKTQAAVAEAQAAKGLGFTASHPVWEATGVTP